MSGKISKFQKKDWPEGLFEIPQKPKQLYIRGKFPDKDTHKFLCIVGSRKHSGYAEEAIKKLVSGLKGKNIVIVSGLAIGIDTLAHKAALENDLKTVAVLGTGVAKDAIYPMTNRRLSEKIIGEGGCVLSEFEKETPQQWSFPARNRIMAGISDTILVIEANEKSGTLITARMALDYNKELLMVPTTIFSNYGRGSNRLLREGARAVFESKDILESLNLPVEEAAAKAAATNLNKKEKQILKLIRNEINTFDEIILNSKFDSPTLSQILMEMEIKGLIIKTLGKYESLI
jgi:DNA processing protein